MSEEQGKYQYSVDRKKLAEVLKTPSIMLPAGAKLVLLHLLSFCRQHYFCWPGQKTIANNLGMSDRHVRNHLAVLYSLEIIKKMKKGYKVPTKDGGFYSRSTGYDLSYLLRKTLIKKKKATGNLVPEKAEK